MPVMILDITRTTEAAWAKENFNFCWAQCHGHLIDKYWIPGYWVFLRCGVRRGQLRERSSTLINTTTWLSDTPSKKETLINSCAPSSQVSSVLLTVWAPLYPRTQNTTFVCVVWRLEVDTGYLLQWLFISFFWDRFFYWTWSSLMLLDWLASKSLLSLLPTPIPSQLYAWWNQTQVPMLVLY